MHKKFQKVLWILTAIIKSQFSPAAANFCCGWVKSPIYVRENLVVSEVAQISEGQTSPGQISCTVKVKSEWLSVSYNIISNNLLLHWLYIHYNLLLCWLCPLPEINFHKVVLDQ